MLLRLHLPPFSLLLLAHAIPSLSSYSTALDPHVDSVIRLWTASHNIPLPINTRAIKQHTWDAPVIAADKASLWSSLTDSNNRVSLLAVSSPHSGDWLHALPMASCGTRLDNEAIRVAVGLRLGINLCEQHICPYGTLVDAMGSRGLSCKRSAGRSIRHHQLNNLILRDLTRARIPSVKENAGLYRSDGKRPDVLRQVPRMGRDSGGHARSYLPCSIAA